uniref:Uncharacterized protein n=1 Tax=Cacopsylla melanoneura TaxID=428564 RepID=A0A8D8Z8F1_9HEMI
MGPSLSLMFIYFLIHINLLLFLPEKKIGGTEVWWKLHIEFVWLNLYYGVRLAELDVLENLMIPKILAEVELMTRCTKHSAFRIQLKKKKYRKGISREMKKICFNHVLLSYYYSYCPLCFLHFS